MKQVAEAELKKSFFPQLIDNLKELDKRLSDEEVGGGGYVELLGRGWRSTMILEFHMHYRVEEEIFTDFKQDLERYETEMGEWRRTGDETLGEKAIKRKTQIREKLTRLIRKLEELK